MKPTELPSNAEMLVRFKTSPRNVDELTNLSGSTFPMRLPVCEAVAKMRVRRVPVARLGPGLSGPLGEKRIPAHVGEASYGCVLGVSQLPNDGCIQPHTGARAGLSNNVAAW